MGCYLMEMLTCHPCNQEKYGLESHMLLLQQWSMKIWLIWHFRLQLESTKLLGLKKDLGELALRLPFLLELVCFINSSSSRLITKSYYDCLSHRTEVNFAHSIFLFLIRMLGLSYIPITPPPPCNIYIILSILYKFSCKSMSLTVSRFNSLPKSNWYFLWLCGLINSYHLCNFI